MKKRTINSYVLILLSFISVIIVGTILLLLPFTVNGENSLSFIDALFMATSATCLTGLSTVSDIGISFSVFGKIVIGLLVEIGGLSFITLAIFFLTLTGNKIGIKERYLAKDMLNLDNTRGVIRLVKKIVIISLVIQALGAIVNTLILSIGYKDYYSFSEALGIGVFHSISSYNNAGFDIFNNGIWQENTSMQFFRSDLLLNMSTMFLIILGGLSVLVILEVIEKKKWKTLSLNSKIVLTMSLSLIIFGALFIKLIDWNNITILEAFFQSVSSRTAGFVTIDLKNISNASLGIIMILMFIGASPCSTGGGIKTTTFFTIIASIIGIIRGKEPHVFNREFPKNAVNKAFLLFVLAIFTISTSALLVSIFNKNLEFMEVLFEVMSSFTTAGLSTGITTSLAFGSKLVLVFTMLIGRVGLMTLINITNRRVNTESKDSFDLVEGKIIIG